MDRKLSWYQHGKLIYYDWHSWLNYIKCHLTVGFNWKQQVLYANVQYWVACCYSWCWPQNATALWNLTETTSSINPDGVTVTARKMLFNCRIAGEKSQLDCSPWECRKCHLRFNCRILPPPPSRKPQLDCFPWQWQNVFYMSIISSKFN